jgi:5-hydroxyisourate hydrolase
MTITIQVLDNMHGRPAGGVNARLEVLRSSEWTTISVAETNDKGYVEAWDSHHLERGLYRIIFDSDSYFARLGVVTGCPEAIVVFKILNHLHDFQGQVNLSPYSYSTYFGTVVKL